MVFLGISKLQGYRGLVVSGLMSEGQGLLYTYNRMEKYADTHSYSGYVADYATRELARTRYERHVYNKTR